MNTYVSAILCTHNPNIKLLNRTLQSIKEQTLNCDSWELIVIDNKSSNALEDQIDISWHPKGVVIVEEELGLAPARIRGFKEAKGELIICLDDDIFLEKDFFQNALNIYNDFPFIGVWGTQILPEFEEEPKYALDVYGNASRIVEKDIWSNMIDEFQTMPWGAGMCVRKSIADKYILAVNESPDRLKLGRKGTLLLSNEDLDLVFFACSLGYGKGIFKELKLTHYVPRRKMTDKYLTDNAYGNAYSSVIQNKLLFNTNTIFSPKNFTSKIIFYLKIIFDKPINRKIKIAKIKAARAAQEFLKKRNNNNS